MTKQESYNELIWMLAKTDFKLRYHGSVLGYFWTILKPLLMFVILYLVFSSIFKSPELSGRYYSLQLLVGIVLFNFFSEGSMMGMRSLLYKAQLVTKIYIPRWTIILASTINASLFFLMNLIIIIFFFALNRFLPSLEAVLTFILFSIISYLLILAFSLFTAPLYVKFRDLISIWEVVLSALFYATPIIYPLHIFPPFIQKIVLFNPIAFIIHFSKESLIANSFPSALNYILFFIFLILFCALGVFSYQRFSVRIAEEI